MLRGNDLEKIRKFITICSRICRRSRESYTISAIRSVARNHGIIKQINRVTKCKTSKLVETNENRFQNARVARKFRDVERS